MNGWLSGWVKERFPDSKRDLCTCFIERGFGMLTKYGYSAMVTMESWMFLSSFERMRKNILHNHCIATMVYMNHMVMRIAFNTCATIFANHHSDSPGLYTKVEYQDLTEDGIPFEFPVKKHGPKHEKGALEALADPDCGWFYRADAEGFGAIPGSPIAYWATDHFIDNCREGSSVSSYACFTGSQNITADNAKYVRFSWEVSLGDCSEQGTWVPYAKGGDFRRWFGNIDSVVNWSTPARSFYAANKTSNLLDNSLWYSEGITYTDITSGKSHFRYLPSGCVFDKAGPSIVCFNLPLWGVLGLFNSSTAQYYFDIFNPTLHLQTRDVKAMPIKAAVNEDERIQKLVVENVRLSQLDWDSFECSKGFKRHPLF